MTRALFHAARGRGRTSPNPMVGAVVVSPDGIVLGQGFHARAGEPHAEINALNEAGEGAQGATLYCTLEPCSHIGRTGPCVVRIVEAGILRGRCRGRGSEPARARPGIRLPQGTRRRRRGGPLRRNGDLPESAVLHVDARTTPVRRAEGRHEPRRVHRGGARAAHVSHLARGKPPRAARSGRGRRHRRGLRHRARRRSLTDASRPIPGAPADTRHLRPPAQDAS